MLDKSFTETLGHKLQVAALPKELKESNMKALRIRIIQLPGCFIHHARQVFVRLEGIRFMACLRLTVCTSCLVKNCRVCGVTRAV